MLLRMLYDFSVNIKRVPVKVMYMVIKVTLHRFFVDFSIPVAATVDVMVSVIGPKWSTCNSNAVIGPI